MSRCRKTIPALILCLLVGPALAGCARTTTRQSLTGGQRVQILESLDFVWSKIHDEFWDPTFHGRITDARGRGGVSSLSIAGRLDGWSLIQFPATAAFGTNRHTIDGIGGQQA